MSLLQSPFFLMSQIQCDDEGVLEQSEIVARIEGHVLAYLSSLSKDPQTKPVFSLPSTSSKNVLEIKNYKTDQIMQVLGQKQQITTKTDQILIIFSLIHNHLLSKKSMNLREAFYLVKPHPSFQQEGSLPQSVVNQRIQDAASILKCSRGAIGVKAAARGLAIGHFKLWMNEAWRDCSAMTIQLTDDLVDTMSAQHIQSDAAFILVIEKETIFRRLIDDNILLVHQHAILVTGCGYPSLSTRKFVAMIESLLAIPVLGVVDFNPGGVSILCTYKTGARASGFHSFRYAVSMRWLGLLGSQLDALTLEEAAYQPFTQTDHKRLVNLAHRPFVMADLRWSAAVQDMLRRNRKLDLDVIDDALGAGSLSRLLLKHLFRNDWI